MFYDYGFFLVKNMRGIRGLRVCTNGFIQYILQMLLPYRTTVCDAG